MAEELEHLFIRLDADIERLRRAMRDADKSVAAGTAGIEKSLARTRPAFDGLNKQMQALGSRMAGIFAGSALVAFTKGALDMAGGLGELSEQVGINTDLLQTLQYASGQAGLKFEETTRAIAKLTDRIGEAADGNTEAVQSFQRIGVAFRDAWGNPRETEAVLTDVSNALAKMPTAAERAAAATDLFGRAGQKLLPILSKGEEGLKGFAAEAERLGLVLPKDKIEAADKAMDKLAQTMLRLKVQTASVAAEPLSDLIDGLEKLNDWTEEHPGLIKYLQAVSTFGLSNLLPGGFARWAFGDEPKPAASGSVTIPMPPPPRVNPNSPGQFSIVPDMNKFAPGVRDEALFDFTKRLQEQRDEISNIFADLELDARRSLGGIGALLQTDYTRSFDELEKKLTDLGASQVEIWEGTALLIQAKTAGMKKALDDIKSAVDENDVAWENWLHGVSDSLAAAALRADSLGDALKRILLQLAESELSNLIYGALGGTGKTGSILKGAGKLLGFADGGVPPVGVPSIVGERGPEVFVPSTKGRIIPNHALGGTTINVTVNSSPNFAGNAATKADLVAIAAVTKKASVDAVMELLPRIGPRRVFS